MIRPLPIAVAPAVLAVSASAFASGDAYGMKTNHLVTKLLLGPVLHLTLAFLDWAVCGYRPILHTISRPQITRQTSVPLLGAPLFANLFVARTQAATREREALEFPPAWLLFFSWIETEDYQGYEVLVEVTVSVSWERWDVKRPGQEIASASVMNIDSERMPQLWIMIEFLTGMKVGMAFGDADGDGLREVTGQVKPELIDGKISTLRRDYLNRPLDADELKGWATELVSLLYNKYQTDTIDPAYLDEADERKLDKEPEIRDSIRQATSAGLAPSLLLRGKPTGHWIYNALFIDRSDGVSKTPTKAAFVAHLAAQLGHLVKLIAPEGSPLQAVRDLLRKSSAILDEGRVVVLLFSECFFHPSFEWKPLPCSDAASSINDITTSAEQEEKR